MNKVRLNPEPPMQTEKLWVFGVNKTGSFTYSNSGFVGTTTSYGYPENPPTAGWFTISNAAMIKFLVTGVWEIGYHIDASFETAANNILGFAIFRNGVQRYIDRKLMTSTKRETLVGSRLVYIGSSDLNLPYTLKLYSDPNVLIKQLSPEETYYTIRYLGPLAT